MKRSKTRVFNDFHGTSTSFLGVRGTVVRLSKRQVRRIGRDLCGHSDCFCSGSLGLRGDQSDIGEAVVYSTGCADVEVLP